MELKKVQYTMLLHVVNIVTQLCSAISSEQEHMEFFGSDF